MSEAQHQSADIAQAGAAMVAPVLIAPRVFEPDLCLRLIAHFDAAAPGGVRDLPLQDPELRRAVVNRIDRNLAPMVARALQFRATRLERHLITCRQAGEPPPYDVPLDPEGAPVRMACTIGLDVEPCQGGDFRFPEFGPRVYRAPMGGALVHSCSLPHETTPVTAGRRYAFVSLLYDTPGSR